MPLYFFHIVTPVERIEDGEGLELPDLDSARREAIDSLRSILAEETRRGVLGLDEWIEVADAAGKLLFTIRSGDALSLATSKASKVVTVAALRPRR
jgi:hypothetical protein